MDRTPIQQWCTQCGSRSHLKGVACPLSCSSCEGDVDDDGHCVGLCWRNHPVYALQAPPISASQIEIGKFYMVSEWDGSASRVTLTDQDLHSVTIEYDDGLVNQVTIDYFRLELQATLLILN